MQNDNTYRTYLVVLFVANILAIHVFGQQGKATANPYKNSIRIGEQIQVDLTLVSHEEDQVQWPELTDTLVSQVEIVEQGPFDTLFKDTLGIARARIIQQSIKITSFDSGLWAVPPLLFIVNDTPLETEAFLVEVTTIEIDTTQNIRDIKAPYELPMTFEEFMKRYGWYIAAVYGFLSVLMFLIYRWGKQKRKIKVLPPPPKIPAHERAYNRLESLRKQKLWQAGNSKGYHSQLSEIIREYVENRYKVTALESTTEEISLKMKMLPIDGELQKQLTDVLTLSDLVKFAKVIPIAAENELCFEIAKRFIEETKQKEIVEPIPTESNEE